MAAFKDAHGGEKADTGAQAGAADLELARQLALGRKAVSGFDLARGDEGPDVVDDLHGELAVRGGVGDGGLFFHCANVVLLEKWEKGNTEAGGIAKRAYQPLHDRLPMDDAG